MPYKDPEKRREMQRIYTARYAQTERGHAVRQRANHAYYDRHGPKAKQGTARQAVHKAIAAGTLTPQPCEKCGNDEAQAHHHLGYAKADRLNVLWLCRLHHQAAHGRGNGNPINRVSTSEAELIEVMGQMGHPAETAEVLFGLLRGRSR